MVKKTDFDNTNKKNSFQETFNRDFSSMSIKEQRIRKIAPSYYARQDIRKSILDFSKNRECVPRYFEGFGKRPDVLNYESDILELAKKGATSFHCSEELWQDPLEIVTGMNEKEFNDLRIGWDLLLDIDSKYFDYSKVYSEILVQVLKENGVNNIGVKFSGSKGMHIIVPWKAFPKEFSGKQTKDMFPEWPRLICRYLGEQIASRLKDRILDLEDSNKTDSKIDLLDIYCTKCGNVADKKFLIYFQCPGCKTQMQGVHDIFDRKRKIRCPNCSKIVEELRREEFYLCPTCSKDSKKDPSLFKEKVKTQHIDADMVLVAPRHLFRMPYSLHEKTGLASVVIDKNKINDFELKDADPLKIKPIPFLPESKPEEAKTLLLHALEYRPPEIQNIDTPPAKSYGKKQFNEVIIDNLTPDLYPPSIKEILNGVSSDGRKRALFILLSFFKSLKIEDQEIRKIINEWNKKNYEPLKSGYINAQFSWYNKNSIKLPPNYDKHYYRDIGINPTKEELDSKNPVSYVIKQAFKKGKVKKIN